MEDVFVVEQAVVSTEVDVRIGHHRKRAWNVKVDGANVTFGFWIFVSVSHRREFWGHAKIFYY